MGLERLLISPWLLRRGGMRKACHVIKEARLDLSSLYVAINVGTGESRWRGRPYKSKDSYMPESPFCFLYLLRIPRSVTKRQRNVRLSSPVPVWALPKSIPFGLA